MKKVERKITYISDRFPHITETFTFNEVNGLKKEGLDVQVYSFKRPETLNLTLEMKKVIKDTLYFPSFSSQEIYLSQFYFFFHIPMRYFCTMYKVILGRYQRFTTFKLRLRSIANFLRGVHLSFLLKNVPNSTHIHAQFANNTATAGYICNRFLGISYSFRNHSPYNPILLKDKIDKSEFVLSISKYNKRQLLDWCGYIHSDKIEVDYLGVDVKEWEREEFKEENGLIVSVGSLSETKGYEFLILAAEIMKKKNLRFIINIIGDGYLREKIDYLIQNKKLSKYIKILGYMPHIRINELMSRASIFCLPCIVTSNGDVDGIPISCMEAMALGKPVISTNVSGIPELIDDGINGILVQQKDPTALANAIEKLLKDAKLRERLGKEARRKIERDFNLCKNIKKTANIFREYILK